ncbi:SSI family serine proteinase inhibitor [Sphaerisporangium sp. NPDC049002]|uniref:SSI family serine proteinase inhibitor n=1 Tax=unclassified Sphaerisporangium TaxID=2630420 RepID=UPI0033FF9199
MRDRGIHLRRLYTGLSCLALVLGAAAAAGSAAGASAAWDPPPGAPGLGDQPPGLVDQPLIGATPPPGPHILPFPKPTPPGPLTGPTPGPHPWPTPGPHTGPTPGPHPWPPAGPHTGPTPGPHTGTVPGSPDRRTRSLVLSKQRGITPLSSSRVVTVRCSPPGGTHPSAASACRVLIPVGGDVSRLSVALGTHCPRIFSPVTVTAIGTWDGRHISVRHTYSNSCTLRAATGSVYDF